MLSVDNHFFLIWTMCKTSWTNVRRSKFTSLPHSSVVLLLLHLILSRSESWKMCIDRPVICNISVHCCNKNNLQVLYYWDIDVNLYHRSLMFPLQLFCGCAVIGQIKWWYVDKLSCIVITGFTFGFWSIDKNGSDTRVFGCTIGI